jgi:outer membrane protein TolC
MSKMRVVFACFGLLVVVPSLAHAQTQLDPQVIKARIKEHSLGVKAAQLAKERTALPEVVALSRYATMLSAEGSYLYNETDSFTSPAEGRTSVASLGGGVSRTLRSGTQIQLGLESAHSDFNARTSGRGGALGDRSAYTLGLVAGVSQPLLRNAWGEADVLRVQKARKLKATTDLQIQETEERLIQSGLELYYRALVTQAEVRESTVVHGRLADLLRETKRKLRFNLQLPGELPTLEAETRTWLRRIQQGNETLASLKTQLRSLLRFDTSEDLVFGDLSVPNDLQLPSLPDKPRSIQIQENELAMAQDELAIAGSEAKGDLTLNLQVKSTGLEPELTETVGEAGDGSRPTFILGVKWQAPTSTLRFDAERYDRAIAVRQQELEKQRLEEQLRADVDVARRNVETTFRLAKETDAIVKLWEKGAREQEKGYAQGRVSLVEIIRTLNALSQAKLEWMQYVTQHQINVVAYEQLTDRLVP